MSQEQFEERHAEWMQATIEKTPAILDQRFTAETYEAFADRKRTENISGRERAPLLESDLRAQWKTENKEALLKLARSEAGRLFGEFHNHIIGSIEQSGTYLALQNFILSKRAADSALPDLLADEEIKVEIARYHDFVQGNLNWLQKELTELRFDYFDKSQPSFDLTIESPRSMNSLDWMAYPRNLPAPDPSPHPTPTPAP